MTFLSGLLIGYTSGVVTTVGVEVSIAVACYTLYRLLKRIGWLKEVDGHLEMD